MKKRIITAIIPVVIGLFAQAQTQYAPNFILNHKLTGSQHYRASQFIEMGINEGNATGFEYNAISSNEFKAEIDPFMVFPPVEGELGGPNAGDQGIVGSIDGVFDVSDLGAATYTIPIKLPMGVGGTVPPLSLTYSSMVGNGLLGIGWNIEAISGISRTGKTIYHDGRVEGPQYNSSDNLNFDGMRMMSLGNNIYTTEVEGFNHIKIVESNSTGPVSFEVKTRDGKILRFGQTENSRQKLANTETIITWYLSSIEDLLGNLITYTYEHRNGNLLLKEIKYGGNDKNSQGHIYQVRFIYIYDRIDPFTNYINGMSIKNDCLLDHIIIKYIPQNMELFKYSLEYDSSSLISSRLTKVKLEDTKNSQEVNPTTIEWGEPTDNFTLTATNIMPKSNRDAEYTLGDFNGDGKADILAAYYYKENGVKLYDTWSIFYLNEAGTSYYEVEMGSLNQPYQPLFVYFVAGDFNGDGRDDLLKVIRNSSNSYTGILLESDGNYGFSSQGSIDYNFGENHYIKITDMNGNGINEILIVSILTDHQNNKKHILLRCFEKNQSNNFFQSLFVNSPATDGYFFTVDKDTELFPVQPGDFTGNGRTDLLVNTDNLESTIFTLHPTEPVLTELVPTRFGFPNRYHRVFTGDFNGDGITDILTYAYANPNIGWELHYFNGKNTWIEGLCPITFNSDPGNTNHIKRYIYTSDINGDGKTDILDIYMTETYSNNANFTVYYSKGNSFKEVETLLASMEYSQDLFDFNGDGKLETLLWTQSYTPLNIMSYHKEEKSNLAKSIINGHDYKISVSYLPLTNSQIYQKTLQKQFPVVNYQPSYFAVRSIKKDIGDNHLTTQTFKYEDLLVHRQGKGLLGFGKRLITNSFTGVSVERTNEIYTIQNKFYVPYTKKIKTKKANGEIISLIENTINHQSFPSSPLRIFPYIESTHYTERNLTTNDFVKTVHKDFSYDNYGNLISSVELIALEEKQSSASASQYEHQITTNFQYLAPDLTNWLISRPEKITKKVRYFTEEQYEPTLVFSYYPSGHSSFPLLNERKIHPKNILTNKLSTSELYSYDEFGNMNNLTLSAPYSTPLLETRTSDIAYGLAYHHRFPTSHTDALGNTSISTYDPVYGILNTSTDPNDLTTHYDSNPLGTYKKITSPDGVISTTVKRWARGNIYAPNNAQYYTWEQTSGTPKVLVFYHKTGVELRSVSFGFDGYAIYVDKIYNNKGLLYKESLPYRAGTSPIYTKYEYDIYNRLKKVIAPDNTTTNTSYSANQVTISVTDGSITRTSSRKHNAAGWLIESTDNAGNVVKNEYHCNGNLKKSYIVGQASTKVLLEYDDMGNRSLINDPNYGSISTVYNAFGELVQQTNPKNDTITFKYDKLGRITNETRASEGAVSWNYSTVPGKLGTLESIIKNNHRTNFVYDPLLRLTAETDIIDGVSYNTNYTYDDLGRPLRTTYPTGVIVRDGYNTSGYHATVHLENNGKQLWHTEQINAMGQITRFSTGNGLISEQTYYPLTSLLHTVQTVKSGNAYIQDFEYKWFGLGNLEYRKKWVNGNKKTSLTESFAYDGLDRLTKVSLNGTVLGNYEYDAPNLGNMTYSQSDGQTLFSDASYGTHGYGPHAVTKLTTTNPILIGPRQDIVYNGYDKVSSITEGNHSLQIQYGHHRQRISQQYSNDNSTIDKIWSGACEFILKDGELYQHTYLSGPMGLFAIHIIKPDGTEEINYIHTDHLGSWNTITDESGNLLQELSFDAWGNRRDPATWRAFAGIATAPLFDRGFTGHEHLYAFNLINMNGRMYDPMVSRMLSPDNYIQAPDFSQSFNRYSYAWNNPLVFTDLDG
ncbi:MAG: FG-GAP-like repeat-containing protein, partial [Acholeplasmataceae bacterium]|nr:FG-GAP-like repeat-containing protein [Acholeplasmataceae bacterium]